MKKNLITTLFLFSLPVLAFAANDNEREKSVLKPILVYSAYAEPVSRDQAASSVTVLTEKDFADRDATYVSDVLKTVPSLAITSSGGRGELTNFYLRGADANHVVVVIDGVKMNPVTGYGYDFGGLSLSNIDRIEVLRGEQSALWGSDAMGGVIYITTKSGLYKEKPFNADFNVGTGSHGSVDGSATVSGYSEGFYYAVHGDSHHTRGISAGSEDTFHYTAEDGTALISGGNSEKDKFHRDNASIRFGYSVSDKGIDFLASHSSQTTHYDDYGTLPIDGSYDNYTHTRENVFKLSGYLGNEQSLFKHQAKLSYDKTDSNSYEAYSDSNYHAKRFNANYQFDVNFDREGNVKQTISLLADYQQAKYSASYNMPSYSTYSYSFKDKSLIDKSLAAEYRLFTEQDNGFSISGRFNDSSEYDNAWTGRISGAYHLTPNFKAHASLGTAIQNPTMTEYYGYNGSYIANLALKPERSRGGDLGLLMESDDKRHNLDITYFARNVSDAIDSRYINGKTQAYNKAGTSHIRGVEIAYNGKLTDSLTAYANYTYTKAEDSGGVELSRRVKHLANAGLAYQFTEQFGGNLNVSYVGTRYNSYGYYDSGYNYISTRVKLPSYTLVNLGVDYKISPNLTVYADLNNLFDKKYENTLGYGQDGRNLYIGLKGSF